MTCGRFVKRPYEFILILLACPFDRNCNRAVIRSNFVAPAMRVVTCADETHHLNASDALFKRLDT